MDVVIHLAARVSTPFANVEPDFHEQVNHWGTAELASGVEESNVKKFIFTSSTSVYGASADEITEESPTNPKSFYGISKLRAEDHIKRLMESTNSIIFRCANVYGFSRSMRFDAVINKFMFDANFKNRIQIHGNGKQYRAFIHVNVLIQALMESLFCEIPSGIYNLVDKNMQILEIVDVLKSIYPDLEFIFINQHLDLQPLRVNRTSKVRSYITFENESSLMEELLDFKSRFAF